jgi:phosphoglucosamine mutase
MNEAFAFRLGWSAAVWSAAAGAAGEVLLGRDTRASGPSLLAAVAAGIAAAGPRPLSLGILPTPAVARAVQLRGSALGVVLTASHNPAADNGIKFFSRGGRKLTDTDEAAIESHLEAAPAPRVSAVPEDGRAVQEYRDWAATLLPAGALAGWRLVVDCAHGATVATTPDVLRRLGAEVIALGLAPDGLNINAGVGSEYPETLCATVQATGARLGLAHDGDGDRLVLCDETGARLDGDDLLTLLALDALDRGALPGRTLVVTEQSNLGIDAAVASRGGRVLRTPTGDRQVIARMRAEGATLGGETSGHIVCGDVSPTGDGLVAALRVLEVMLRRGEPLSRLRRQWVRFPQRTAALRVRDRPPLASLPALSAAIAAVEAGFAGRGRVLVRYSGTEPLLRLLVEGPTEAEVAGGLAALAAAARSEGIAADD